MSGERLVSWRWRGIVAPAASTIHGRACHAIGRKRWHRHGPTSTILFAKTYGTALVLQIQRGRVMNRPARLIAGTLFAATFFCSVASAQVNLQPTPAPSVTAENEA